ncbi:MAG: GatB/YqeY domain-containing protein [Anaerolineae bacterium]
MGLREQLMDELKEAMRQQDERRKRTIRSVIAAMKQAETELDASGARIHLDDEGILALIAKQAKQRQDSIVEFQRGNRPDLVAEEEAELALLQTYLPQQLGRAEIEAEARRVIAEVGASGLGDIGKVMKPLMANLRNRADGRVVNEVVRELLAG